MNSSPAASELAGKPTLIGSFPFTEHREAVRLVLEYTPEIPCWPQLPARGEGMLVQFSSGLPGFDPEKLVVDPGRDDFEEERLRFYEEYLSVTEGGEALEETRFFPAPDEVPGLYVLLEAVSGGPSPLALKGQITGPFTLATGLKTPDGRALFYDPELRDLVIKLVALKARAQAEFLGKAGRPVVVFLDEPALSGFGSSAFVGVSREEVLSALSEVISEIRRAGALVGIHVCGNTDWSLLTESPIQIVNFDAYDFSEKFIAYDRELKEFIKKGGRVAWGLVPTLRREDLERVSPGDLLRKFESLVEELSSRTGLSPGEILRASLFTPSCGMGTLSPELVRKALSDLRSLSEALSPSFR